MSSVRRSLVLSFIEKYSSLLINIVATMIVARLLTPVETGIYSVAAGIINIAQELRDVGVPTYVLQERDLTRSRLATATTIAVGMGFILFGAFALMSGPIGHYFDEPRMQTVVLVMSLCFIGVAFASIGQARLRRAMNFNAVLRIGICCTLVHAVTSVVLANKGYGPVAMAWASVLGIWTAAIGNLFYFPRDTFLPPSLKEWQRVMHIGAFVSGAALLQEVGQRASDIIIGRLLGFGQAGLFSRGNGLITLFQQALMHAVIPVVQSDLAMLNRNREDIRAPFLRYLGSVTAVAWPALGMTAVLALPIIYVFFGDQWLAAVPVAQILCAAAVFMVVGQLCITLFTAIGAVRRSFAVRLVSVPVQVALLAIGSLFNIELAACAVLVSSVVFAVLAVHHLNHVLATTWHDIARALLQSLLIAIATLVIPVVVTIIHAPTTADFIVTSLAAILSAALCWLAALFILRHPLRDEILLVWSRVRARYRLGSG